jgi:hypothetical protein
MLNVSTGYLLPSAEQASWRVPEGTGYLLELLPIPVGYGTTHQYICKKVPLSARKLTTILHTKLLNNFKFRIKLNETTGKLPVVLIML